MKIYEVEDTNQSPDQAVLLVSCVHLRLSRFKLYSEISIHPVALTLASNSKREVNAASRWLRLEVKGKPIGPG